ncbi:MAG: hypothetical protein R3B65_02585 [Candidatus Paceibacterota bacterium]
MEVEQTNIEEIPEPENIFTETSNPEYENQNVAGVKTLEEKVYTNWFERFIINYMTP